MNRCSRYAEQSYLIVLFLISDPSMMVSIFFSLQILSIRLRPAHAGSTLLEPTATNPGQDVFESVFEILVRARNVQIHFFGGF